MQSLEGTGKLGLPCSILSRERRRTILQAPLDLSPPLVILIMRDALAWLPQRDNT